MLLWLQAPTPAVAVEVLLLATHYETPFGFGVLCWLGQF